MHPTDVDLLAFLHGEPVPLGAYGVRSHVEECPDCFRRCEALAGEESWQRNLLLSLDAPVPPIAVELIRRQAIQRRRAFRIAASIGGLLAVTSVAAAIPGSPVRNWLREVTAPQTAPAQPAAPDRKTQTSADGVQVSPVGSLVILLGNPQAAGQVRIVRTDQPTATVRAVGGDVGYRIGPGRISVDNRLPAEHYEVTIPRSLDQFTFLSNGRVLFRLGPDDRARALDTVTVQLSRGQGRTP